MQTQHKKLQTHEKELILRSCVVAECHTTSKNILNKEIREYVGVHMRVAELAYTSPEFIRHLITTFALDVKTGNANLFQFTQRPQNNNYSKNYSQRPRNYFLLRLKKHNSISVTTTRELRTQRAYPWTHPDMSQSQDDNILDSITVAGSQPTPQAGSTAIQDVTNETTIEATNLNVGVATQ
jgi:hypothetical protein